MDVVRQPNQGWIEVIVGSMFSGKSEELIRRLRRAQIARQKVQIFKPVIDPRFADDHIVSHSEMRIASCAVHELARAARRGRRRHRGDRHRRRAVLRSGTADDLRHAGGSGQARHRGRPRPGLPRQAVRADAAAAGDRRSTSPRRRRSAWCAAIPRTTRSGWSPAAIASSSAPRDCTRRDAARCFDPLLAGPSPVTSRPSSGDDSIQKATIAGSEFSHQWASQSAARRWRSGDSRALHVNS